MSSSKTKEKNLKNESLLNKFSIDNLIPEKYQTLALILVIFVIFLIYFSPMYFGNHTFQSGDITTTKSIRGFLDNEREDFTLWYPYIFCGMPAYALAVDYKWFNLLYVGLTSVKYLFTSFFTNDYSVWTLYLLILAFTSYFLVTYLTKNRLIGLFAALSSSFSTGIIVFLFIGHVTKLTALCFFPIVLLMLLKFEERIRLRDFAILVIALQLALQGWHVQVIFYILMAVGTYFLYNLIVTIVQKQKDKTIQLAKSLGLFSSAMIIALLIQSDNLTQIYEYMPYSTRGTKSIVDTQTGVQQQTDSEFYQYATNWSFSPGEVLTFVVPSYYGFGNTTYKGPLTGNREVKVNTYFGQMPFVDVAMYMGVIVFFLALFSIYANWKNRFVQFLAIICGISLLISFGRTFPIAYNLMFNYFPYFDKFRIPSMILILIQLSLPILAGLGLHKIILLRKENNEKLIKIVKFTAFGFTGAFLLSLVLTGSISDWFTGRIANYAAAIQNSQPQLAQQFMALSEFITNMFKTDLYIALGLTSVTFWLAFAYIKSKLSGSILVIAVIMLSMFDLIRIDNRGARYGEAQDEAGLFDPPGYVTIIKKQNDTQPFRMLNLKRDGSLGSFNHNSNYNSYFLLDDYYGYSAVKPRSYQDLMDVVGIVSPTLWRMLNVKYLVTDSEFTSPSVQLINTDGKTFIYKNNDALPRAYFVETVELDTPFNTLNKIKGNTFDPAQTCFVHDTEIQVDKPGEGAYVIIKEYLDEKITIEATATGNNLLFVGDTYYPNGWNAYIDGEEVEIIRVNHGFRGIIVPEGTHEIIFNYLPASFTIAKYTSLILSTLIILGLIFSLLIEKKKTSEIIEA